MSYTLLYHPKCLKRLKKIPQIDQNKILIKLKQLSIDPFAEGFDVKKLKTTENSFRLRTGNLRALYELDQETKTMYIWEIDYRGNVY